MSARVAARQRDLGRGVGDLPRRPPDGHRREVEGVRIAELAVVPGDPADHLPEVAEGLAPAVDVRELLADETPPPVGRGGADQLRLADGHDNASVRPVLGDQQHRRDDPAGGGVLDDDDVVLGPEPGWRALEQLQRPLVHEVAGQVVLGLLDGVELGQLRRVLRGGGAQDEAVGQRPPCDQPLRGRRSHPLILPGGAPAPGAIPRPGRTPVGPEPPAAARRPWPRPAPAGGRRTPRSPAR